jgi:hypothetical protein
MNREIFLSKIKQSFARFKYEVEISNGASQYDINIHSENVLIPLLNALFEANFRNANYESKNADSVDLIDLENRVAVQVTSTSKAAKIEHTISQFVKYKRYEQFDHLYIYIISEKQNSYKRDYLDLVDNKFTFNLTECVFDHTDIYTKIQGLTNLSRIAQIEKLLSEEFSDVRIQDRNNQILGTTELLTDTLSLNLLQIEVPKKLYYADINIDKEHIISMLEPKKRYTIFRNGKKYKKNIVDYIDDFYLLNNQKPIKEWVLYRNKLWTFRNLFEDKESLRSIIDIGTIESDNTIELLGNYESQIRVLKVLIRLTLEEQLLKKSIQYIENDGIFRFKLPGSIAKAVSVQWKKGVKLGTREVIAEIWNKDDTHIVCFRHLAFKLSIEDFDNEYYISINPTWSFTSDGIRKSRFEPEYLSGLKLLETNETVDGHFRFIANYISPDDLFNNNSVIKVSEPILFDFSPSIDDDKWNRTEEKKHDKKQEKDKKEEQNKGTINLFNQHEN